MWYGTVKVGDVLLPNPVWNRTECRRIRKLDPEGAEVLEITQVRNSQTGILFRVRTQTGHDVTLDAGWFTGPAASQRSPVYELSALQKQALTQFLAGNASNAWVKAKGFEVYLRKSRRYLPGSEAERLVAAIDIANITVEDRYRRKGLLRALVQYIESYGRVVYIESIMEPVLLEAVQRWGYTLDNREQPPSAYKIIST
jgi:GNAT superfamily N-acetyltransferase